MKKALVTGGSRGIGFAIAKDLAYNYIKASQQDFVIMADEINDWGIKIVASNDTMTALSGEFVIKCGDEIICTGTIDVGANENEELLKIPVMYSDKKLFTFEWKKNLGDGYNHYICGYPAFDFETYKNEWLPIIKNLQNKIG